MEYIVHNYQTLKEIHRVYVVHKQIHNFVLILFFRMDFVNGVIIILNALSRLVATIYINKVNVKI
jgi:hypothetical protein